MKNKILSVISFLFGLMFINAGLNKFFNYLPAPDDMPERALKMLMAMSEITWLLQLIATFEMIGGILFILPRFRALGAIVLTPIMAGILAHHFILGDGLIIPLLLTAILIWVIVENRHKYQPLINK